MSDVPTYSKIAMHCRKWYSEASPSGKFDNYCSYLENRKRCDKKSQPESFTASSISKKKTYCTLKYDKYLPLQLKIFIAD